MAPTKTAKACKAMKAYDISEETVKAVLKDLLPVYEKNWKYIEDENYRVLLDAIFESQDSKKKEVTEKELRLRDESDEEEEEEECEQPLKKSRLSKQNLSSSSADDSSPCVRTRSSFREQHREEDTLMVTVPSSEDYKGKGKKPQMCSVLEQAEASQVLATEGNFECNLSPGSDSVSAKVFQRKKRSPPGRCKSKPRSEHSRGFSGKDRAFELPRDEVPLAIIHPDGSSTRNLCDTEEFCLEPPKIIHLDAGDISNPSPMGTDDSLDENASDAKENDLKSSYISSSDEDDIYHQKQKGNQSTAKRNELKLPEIIDLDSDEECPSVELCEDGTSDQNSSGHEEKSLACLESNRMDMEDKDNNSPFSSKIDIVSSLKGEVKLSFIYNCPQPCKFQIPSPDAVLKRMEDKYRESFGSLGTDFSLSKLLKDMCECFLEQGPVTMDTEQVASTFDPGSSSKQTVIIMPNGSAPHQNHTKCLPQIPRFLASNRLDFDQYSFGRRFRSTMTVDVQAPSSSSSLAVVQKFDSAGSNTLYYVDDITKGNENRKISLVNEFNNEKQPTFTYIPKNLTFSSAYVKFVLARISDDNCCSNCFGNCISQEIPCACAGETGGEFAYTSEGVIKEKFLDNCVSINLKPQKKDYFYCDDCPLERTKGVSKSGKCKGHLVQKFIKECWYKCGCGQSCGNRVVQRGITAHLQVFMTPEGKGWGIRTLEDLPKGAFVCEYVGEIVTNNELFDRNECNSNEKHTYPVLLDADWSSEGVLRDEEALCLDATSFGNVARFINHRCNDATMVEIPVEIESPDHHYYHLAFFTTREVKAFEELTWDYGIDFSDSSHPVKAFKCCCGSRYCRDMKRRKRTRT